MDRSRIAIVIPAFNESKTIAQVVKSAKAFGNVIVVDDASTDTTSELALKGGATVVSHTKNRGYDGALNSGFLKASELECSIVITVDADGQHNPSLIEQFLEAIEKGADVVVGIRSKKQRISEHIFSWYTMIFFGIYDPLCGMKAYKMRIFHELGHFDSYKSIGTELMIFALRNHYAVDQLGFQVNERDGKPRFGSIINSNTKIFRALFLTICH